MTDRDYLNQMIALVKELERKAFSEPYDLAVSKDFTNRMNSIHRAWLRSRRRRSWLILVFCCVLIFLLAWIVYNIWFSQ